MAVQKRTSTNVLLDTALKNFYAAAEEMKLDDGLVEVLSRPERAICVSIPVQMDDGSVRVFNGYRVQHSTVCGPAKGGLRFHPDVNLEECEALASLMTWKCSLAGIPYGGGKGGISVDPFTLSQREKEMMTQQRVGMIQAAINQDLAELAVAAAADVAKAKSLDFVLSQNTVLFAAQSYDVTQDVLEAMNRVWKAKGSPVPGASAATANPSAAPAAADKPKKK